MESDLLENGLRNIERWSWKHWKMELETLENGIGNIGKWNWKMKLETGL